MRRLAKVAQICAIAQRVVLPAACGQNMIAGHISVTIALHDFCHHLPGHDLAQFDRFGIGFRVIHAPAHIGIKR